MFKSFVQMLGLVRNMDVESRRTKELKDPSVSSKNIAVRIVHPGGREELYPNLIPVSHIMNKYPGMCITRPDVFKKPHESILSAEDKLFPGEKYYIVPSTTVKKLKRKHSEKKKLKEHEEGWKVENTLALTVVLSPSGEKADGSICVAKDFYVATETWSQCIRKRRRRGIKKFVPPIPTPKMWRGLDWEPSLTAVQELSP